MEDWRYRAACAGMDVNVFFPVGSAGPSVAADLRTAKAVCGGCAVQKACLAWAMTMDVTGVWGGLTEQERRDLRRTARPHLTRTIAAPPVEVAYIVSSPATG